MIYSVNVNGKNISKKVKVADSLIDRFVGLMFKSYDPEVEALIINPCNSIHTCFMKYNIDVIFIDKNNFVVKVLKNIKPWRMTLIYLKAKMVIESKAGNLLTPINQGDKIEVLCIN